MLLPQSCPTLCDPMDCSPSGSSVHGILQARILERGGLSFPSPEENIHTYYTHILKWHRSYFSFSVSLWRCFKLLNYPRTNQVEPQFSSNGQNCWWQFLINQLLVKTVQSFLSSNMSQVWMSSEPPPACSIHLPSTFLLSLLKRISHHNNSLKSL